MGSFHLLGCSSPPKQVKPRPKNSSQEVKRLESRVQQLETRLSTINEKVNFAKTGMEQFLKGNSVHQHPSDSRGTPVNPVSLRGGLINDRAIRNYREARLLMDAQNFSDAILAFSRFLQNYPDHPLGGSAQYFIGRAYYEQMEYKLALQELERVLVSYKGSSHYSDALALLSRTHGKLSHPQKAETYRQSLLTLFPQAPSSRNLLSSAMNPAGLAPTTKAPKAPVKSPEKKVDQP